MTYLNADDFERDRRRAQRAAEVGRELHYATWDAVQGVIHESLDQGRLDHLPTQWRFAWDGASSGGWVIGWPMGTELFLTWNGCLLARHGIHGWLEFPSLPRAKIEEYVAIHPGAAGAEWASTVEPTQLRRHWRVITQDPALARQEVRQAALSRLRSMGARQRTVTSSTPESRRTHPWGPLRSSDDFWTNGSPSRPSWFTWLAGCLLALVIASMLSPLAVRPGSLQTGVASIILILSSVAIGLLTTGIIALIIRSSLGRRPVIEKGTGRVTMRAVDYCMRCEEPWGDRPRYCKRNHSATNNRRTLYTPVRNTIFTGGWFLGRGPMRGPQLEGVAIPPGSSLGVPYLSSPPTRAELLRRS